MASVRTLVTIKRAGKYLPPDSTIHGLSDDEVEALLPHVERLPGDMAEPEAAFLTVVEPVELSPAAEPPEAALEPREAGESRVEDIVAAIDLMEADDFAKNGRPKIAALKEVLGFPPTDDELNAALALREEMGL